MVTPIIKSFIVKNFLSSLESDIIGHSTGFHSIYHISNSETYFSFLSFSLFGLWVFKTSFCKFIYSYKKQNRKLNFTSYYCSDGPGLCFICLCRVSSHHQETKGSCASFSQLFPRFYSINSYYATSRCTVIWLSVLYTSEHRYCIQIFYIWDWQG